MNLTTSYVGLTLAHPFMAGASRDRGVCAQNAKVDLIVVGTHGRGGLSRLMMGSVAEKVVRLASCPVLTVGNHEHGFIVPDALQIVEHAKK